MTIHFAPAHNAPRWTLARYCVRAARVQAANDNRPQRGAAAPSDEMLKSALRHFALHGLSAARAARGKAEEAFFAGDRGSYEWWLGITRTLDRRLALEAELRGITRPAANGAPLAPGESHP
jgi:hypothetical protein